MDPLWPVLGFVTVAAITPGPNNFIVLATAARGGLRAAGPTIAGVVAGSLGLLLLVWAGVGPLLDALPRLRGVLVGAGSLYLAWLGVALIRRAGEPEIEGAPSGPGRLPTTALTMAAFQFMNPKGWVLVLTASAAVSEIHGGLAGLGLLAGMFVVVSATCLSVWAWAGAAIVDRLRRPRSRRWFERSMGALLVASAVSLLLSV